MTGKILNPPFERLFLWFNWPEHLSHLPEDHNEVPIMRVLDLFSGAGGMSLGFEMAGFEIICAVDNWEDALKTIKHNSPSTQTVSMDLSNKTSISDFCGELGQVDVVIGGPPCQGFSIAGKRNPEDERNRLYEGFVEAIKAIQPAAFVMENVPSISSPTNLDLFESIISDFEKLGYTTASKVLLASNFGVPQNRRRMFIVGIKGGENDFDFPGGEESRISALEAIGDLPENSLEDGSEYPIKPDTAYQQWAHEGSEGIWNHQVTDHKPKTIEVISLVPDGGNHKSLPMGLSGIRNVNIAWTRLDSRKPSFTIDTGHRHHFHYKFNRVPTARESARLQSFPDAYVFLGSKTSQLRQIGNAVPPLLARSIAESLKMQLGQC